MRYAQYLKEMPNTANEGDLMVWHNTNREMMWLPVQSVDDAKLVISTLAQRDLYLDAKKMLRVDFNAIGLIEYNGSEWLEWYDEAGEGIDEVMEAEEDDEPPFVPDSDPERIQRLNDKLQQKIDLQD